MIHDSRSSDLGKESFLGGLTHAQELAIHLQKLITDQAALDCCLQFEEQAYRLKYQFYDQFLTLVKSQQ
jgi:cell fate regulator YaaT (PSP1 superfamily)